MPNSIIAQQECIKYLFSHKWDSESARPQPIKLTFEERKRAFIKNTVAKFNHRRDYGQKQNNMVDSDFVVSDCDNSCF